MTEGDGLSSLKMSVAGHNCIVIFFCFFSNDSDEVDDCFCELVTFIHKIETKVKGNLVVTASCGVKSLAAVADTLCKLTLNEGVDVLSCHIN